MYYLNLFSLLLYPFCVTQLRSGFGTVRAARVPGDGDQFSLPGKAPLLKPLSLRTPWLESLNINFLKVYKSWEVLSPANVAMSWALLLAAS